MRTPALITLAALFALPSLAGAEIYTWKDASGKTVYSDKPPLEKVPTARELRTRGTSGGEGVAAAPAKAGSDAEGGKPATPPDAAAKPPEKTREQIAAESDARANLCDNARKRLIQLESATGVIVSKNDQGVDVPLVGAARRAEADAVRKEVDHWCK